jgi:PleD family two-component response regulator
VVEVVSERAPTPAQVRGINAVLAVVRNQLGLLDYSERDTLTGLLNRKSFDDSFYKAAIQPVQDLLPDGQAERRQTAPPRYWLAVLDIDHFKQVNDNFGHVIGDEVLLIVSQLMCSTFRYYDQLYRFGARSSWCCCAAPPRKMPSWPSIASAPGWRRTTSRRSSA